MIKEELPTPLTIIFEHEPGPYGDTEFRATSPEHPELIGTACDAGRALAKLNARIMWAIETANDEEPLSEQMVAALLAAGHSLELVEAWDRTMRGHTRYFRYNANAAVEVLRDYARHGVPPLAACEFVPLREISEEEAGRIHAAGYSAEHCRLYVEANATDPWEPRGFDVVEWALSGVPADRVWLYFPFCSTTDAVAWEALVSAHGISDRDLEDIIRARFTLQDYADNHAAYGDGVSVGDAARTLLGLAKGEQEWESDEPPF